MKKTAFVLASMLTAAAFASSDAYAQGIRFGVKGGANLSNLSGDLTNEDVYDNKYGFHGGLMLNVGLVGDGFLSIQPEVLFSQKGYKYADDSFTVLGQTYTYKGEQTYNYIDVPVLLKVNAGGLFFEAGPQYSYLLSVKDNSERRLSNGTTYSRVDNRDLDNVRRNEIGYAAGLGYQSPIGLLLGLRYNGAFTDFAKNGYRDDELRNARNSVFQLSLGYLIPSR
jgi:hypothetical protein